MAFAFNLVPAMCMLMSITPIAFISFVKQVYLKKKIEIYHTKEIRKAHKNVTIFSLLSILPAWHTTVL